MVREQSCLQGAQYLPRIRGKYSRLQRVIYRTVRVFTQGYISLFLKIKYCISDIEYVFSNYFFLPVPVVWVPAALKH